MTRTLVPKRKFGWAAVIALGFIRSPEAVLELIAYHDALPHCALAIPSSLNIKSIDASAKNVVMDLGIADTFLIGIELP